MKSLLLTALAITAALPGVAQPPDFTPATPLLAAAYRNDTPEVKRLLDAGANPNEGRFLGMAPIFLSLIRNNPEMFAAMAAKGAALDAVDPAGSTTLMWAAANEQGDDTLVQELLRLGVNPATRNKLGETALSWAERRGQTPAVAALRNATAPTDTDPNRKAVESAIALLQKSGPQFVRVSGCASCHHQSLPQMAYGLARQRGYAVNEKVAQSEVASVLNIMKMMRPAMDNLTDQIPDIPISVSYLLLGLHAEGYAPDDLTTAAAKLLVAKQRPDGGFTSFPARPPMESSDITAAALALRAISLYGAPDEPAIDKARRWLLAAQPRTSEELSMRLLGLAWSKADAAALEQAAQALLATQRPDGGWAQLPALDSDAYATGQALYALYVAGQRSSADASFRRGTAYLLRTQLPDGSWHVRTRAFAFQPLKDSGFPHGRDQWISASGTAWAAMALSLPPAPKAQETSSSIE